LPASLSAHPSVSIPAIDAFQLRLTPFNSTPTSMQGAAAELVWRVLEKDPPAASGE
jgi:hypothetical protein